MHKQISPNFSIRNSFTSMGSNSSNDATDEQKGSVFAG